MGFGRRWGIDVSEQVAGNLQLHKPIVRHVRIQSPDHEIAIVPGVRPVAVEGVTVTLGKAGHVEPVPGPAFSKLLAGEKFIDEPVIRTVRIRRGFGDELFNVFRFRGEADQIEVSSPDQRSLRGRRVGNDAGRFLPGPYETVQRVSSPGLIFDRRQSRLSQRLKRPVLPSDFNVDFCCDHGDAVPRIRSSHLDPLDEVSNQLVRQLAFRRHLERVVFQRCDQQTFVRLARHDSRAAFSALATAVARIEKQSALQIVLAESAGRVTLVAVLNEHRPNLRLEKVEPFSVRVGGLGNGRNSKKHQKDSQLFHSGILNVRRAEIEVIAGEC